MAYNNRQGGFLGWFSSLPTVTKNLLIINILGFIAVSINDNLMVQWFALFVPRSPFFHIWQPITYMFLHGSFFHLFFNMYALLMFGSVLERCIGTKKFLTFYFVCGIGAAIAHVVTLMLMKSSSMIYVPTVGASGAIYGVLIGFAMFYPNSQLTLLFPPITLKAKVFVWIFVGLELLMGVTETADGIAHFAHLGGMVIGYLLLTYWIEKHKLWK